jgi:tRNA/tmRNA/rRNA uracil-C5-methylase (TrmA/RlmC/RlmD family)|tara:strand:+ start:1900 stop:2202 length:303 start_codon:yes stop_codon:yes gene_type:complete
MEVNEFTEVPHQKYWIQRYRLFTSWREGIRLDYESWYSVTPQIIAFLQAKRCILRNLQTQKIPLLVVDAFSGSGSNSAEFASTGAHVISCEINISRIKMV